MTEPLKPSAALAAEQRVVRPARRAERPRHPFFREEGAGARSQLARNLVNRVLNDEFDLRSPFEPQPVFGLIPALAAIRVTEPHESNDSEEAQNGRYFN